MFDLGMMELLVIGIVALIVVGPKDLPMLFRKVGNFVGKMKGMAREFQRSMDQAAKESGINEASSSLHEATDSLKSAANFDPTSFNKDLYKTKPDKTTKPDPPQTDAANLDEPAGKANLPPAKKTATKKVGAKKPAKRPDAKPLEASDPVAVKDE